MLSGVVAIPLPGSARVRRKDLPAGGGPLPGFIAGPENRLLVKAFESVLTEAATLYNPLVLYGLSGSGKSHLVHGLAQWWRRRHRDHEVITLAGSEFAAQLADAVGRQEVEAWRTELRGASLFVLDDVGELAGKRTAQQELCHTLDAIWEHEGFVVVTGRSLPAQLSTLSEPLRSRLSGGLAVAIALPGPAARRALLEQFAAARGLAIDGRACQSLAEGLTTSAVGLLAALMELELRAPQANIDVHRASHFVSERSGGEQPSLATIAGLVARYFGLKVSELKSPLRRQAFVSARGVAMILAREVTDKSLGQIGAYFGGRDHTTVLHACRCTDKLMHEDAAIRQAIVELKRTLVSA